MPDLGPLTNDRDLEGEQALAGQRSFPQREASSAWGPCSGRQSGCWPPGGAWKGRGGEGGGLP